MTFDRLNEKAQNAGYADAYEQAAALIRQQYPATPSDRIQSLAYQAVTDAIDFDDVLERVI